MRLVQSLFGWYFITIEDFSCNSSEAKPERITASLICRVIKFWILDKLRITLNLSLS